MHDTLKGASYLLKGFRLINQKGVRRFAYIPITINTLLFSGAIWLSFTKFDHWISGFFQKLDWMPSWLLEPLMWIIWPLFTLVILVTVFFTFSIVANILAAPFNGLLAEAVETKLLGQTAPEFSWQDIAKDAPKMVWNEIRKLLYILLWVIPLFIISLIPIINFVSPLLWSIFSSWMLAIEYHDYPMGNHQLYFAQQRQVLKQKRMLALGFGGTTLIATMIPIVNFLVIPAAVAGATVLYCQHLKA